MVVVVLPMTVGAKLREETAEKAVVVEEEEEEEQRGLAVKCRSVFRSLARTKRLAINGVGANTQWLFYKRVCLLLFFFP